MADVVTTPEELARAMDQAFTAPDRLREQRRKAHSLFAHAGRATERALHVVYELLELAPAPAADQDATACPLPRFSTPAPPPPRAGS
jgi:hypothetical protein